MASSKSFTFDLTVEHASFRPVVTCLLHAILFQRVLGTLSPKTIDALNLTFCAVQDSSIESLINARVASAEDVSRNGTVRISIRFSQKGIAKKAGWFAHPQLDEPPFETWDMNITRARGSTERERNKIDALTREQLVTFQYRMLELCCEKGDKDKLPPITSSDLSPYNLEIICSPAERSKSGYSPRAGGSNESRPSSGFWAW